MKISKYILYYKYFPIVMNVYFLAFVFIFQKNRTYADLFEKYFPPLFALFFVDLITFLAVKFQKDKMEHYKKEYIKSTPKLIAIILLYFFFLAVASLIFIRLRTYS